ncbi:MAG: four-carbon acid sugar kinase family protein, partial [Clostridiales bacterium]|nr:four-carbon acid sugar kinase family protein [Clostridiales bacterium]
MAKCIGVLADDLTGSMDAGVQLHNDGYTVKIAVDPSSLDVVSENTDIIIINSESRNVPKMQASSKVQYCVQKLQEMGCDLIYKKVDSTLRGNIGIELEAVLNQLDVDCIILAPALPFNERTTVNGIHYVGGLRLQDTELAKDPFSPIYSSSIREIIRKQSSISSANLTIDIIRDSVAVTAKVMEEMINSGFKVIVCDAIDNGDLTCIAKASNRLSHSIVFCGSAGLFKYLVDTGRINQPTNFPKEQIQYSNQSDSVLVLSGSPASISKKQILNAVNSGNRTTAIYADLDKVKGTKAQQEQERDRIFF